MMKKLALLVSICGLSQLNFAQCVEEANVFEFMHDGKIYEIIKENKSWAEAAACAVERGGYLARIDSEEENTALFNAISTFDVVPTETVAPDGGGGAYIWIGATDRAEEGTWIWDGDNDAVGDQFWDGAADGSPVGDLYNNWGDEPDDFGGVQDAGAISVNGWPLGVAGEWNDVNAVNNLYFFVEYDSDGSGLEENNSFEINIFPNPTSDIIFVNVTTKKAVKTIKIITLDGNEALIINQNWEDGIDVSKLATGTYLIEIQLDNGERSIEKFIK